MNSLEDFKSQFVEKILNTGIKLNIEKDILFDFNEFEY